MTIEQMKKIKKEKGYTYDQIAKGTNIPLSTIQKVFGGVTESPRYDTIQALNTFFGKDVENLDGAMLLKDSSVPYGSKKKQGEYTLDDYYAIPDERRVELIDGVIYDMTAPTSIHQVLATRFVIKLANYIDKKKGNCIALVSPLDVQLDCDEKTMVQPDVVVICDSDKMLRCGVYGAPDFVIEILSPSTAKKDSIKKLAKYENAGVREYWIVDPDNRRILVYDFSQEVFPAIYGFDAKIPVAIFGGDLEIDMSEISEYVDRLKL